MNTNPTPLKTWHVTSAVVASKYLGTVQAATKEEAEKLAQELAEENPPSVCRQCSVEIEDPEIERIEVYLND